MKLTEEMESIDKRSALIGAGAVVAGYYLYKKFWGEDEEEDCEDEGAESEEPAESE